MSLRYLGGLHVLLTSASLVNNWIGLPENTQAKPGSPVANSMEKGNPSNPSRVEEEGSTTHGDDLCMGKENKQRRFQKLKNPIGPHSRKRPRLSFLLDHIIGEQNPLTRPIMSNSRDESTGGESLISPIPDQNFSTAGGSREPHQAGRQKMVSMENADNSMEMNGEERIEHEMHETIQLGKELGIDLENAEDQIRATIWGEMEELVAQ
ncbi:hypothetical protein L1987_14462 [Smallanthus sonchifolius]|uniref:Uncharacterized protein n=1 Tax=Smallanthus sonchifolius TaxID=185202 RepID=A0ACB9J3X6_9ASTR|nr:hypothetical protein L1987_14462 [Smallanthus sonchifolius]